MRKTMLVTLIFACVFLTSGCRNVFRTAHLVDYHNQSFETTRSMSLSQIGSVIVDTGKQRGWVMKKAGKGHIVGSLYHGKHFAEIEIRYSQKEFSIVHKKSRNLSYDPAKKVIHRRYNHWVKTLHDDILRAIPQYGM